MGGERAPGNGDRVGRMWEKVACLRSRATSAKCLVLAFFVLFQKVGTMCHVRIMGNMV